MSQEIDTIIDHLRTQLEAPPAHTAFLIPTHGVRSILEQLDSQERELHALRDAIQIAENALRVLVEAIRGAEKFPDCWCGWNGVDCTASCQAIRTALAKSVLLARRASLEFPA